jgi:hypothetical protein
MVRKLLEVHLIVNRARVHPLDAARSHPIAQHEAAFAITHQEEVEVIRLARFVRPYFNGASHTSACIWRRTPADGIRSSCGVLVLWRVRTSRCYPLVPEQCVYQFRHLGTAAIGTAGGFALSIRRRRWPGIGAGGSVHGRADPVFGGTATIQAATVLPLSKQPHSKSAA